MSRFTLFIHMRDSSSISQNRTEYNMADNDKEGISSIISKSMSFIEKHEKEYMVILLNNSELRYRIMKIKLIVQSIEEFCNITNKEKLKRQICELCWYVMEDLQALSGRPINVGLDKVLCTEYLKLYHKIDDAVFFISDMDIYIIFHNTVFNTTYDYILKSLGEISNCKANQNAPSIKEKLCLLHDLLAHIRDTVVDFTREKEKTVHHLTGSVSDAACLLYSSLVGQKEDTLELEIMHIFSNYVKKIFMDFLIRSKVQDSFKDEIYLLEIVTKLLRCTYTYSIGLKDVGEKIYDKLKFLHTFLADLPHEVIIENLIHFAPFIENITAATLHIFHLCYDKEIKEDLFIEVNGVFADVIDQIEDIQVEVEEIKVYNAPKSDVDEIMLFNYPKTDPLGYLDLFLEHVEELLKCQPNSIKFLKNEIETLKDDFNSLRCLLKQIKECEGFEDVRAQIIQLAYQAEHVIDCYLVKHFSNRRIKFTLCIIIEKMKLLQLEVSRINAEKKYVTQADTVEKTFMNNVPSQAIPLITDEVVGLEDEAEKIKNFLFADTKKLDVLSIVGLPGLGKTTLARKLFEDPSVIDHFDVRAWSTVSQTYRKRDVLLTILGDIVRTEEIKTLDDDDLVEKLYKSLKGRRYFIIIDDLWNIEDWNDLSRPFPDDKSQSRIIITSRVHNVASHTKVDSKVHHLREFTINESRELFEKKLFHKGNLSKDFQEVGNKIVESCKGLPLAIVVIASLLSKEEMSIGKWKEITANLRSRILSESESQFKAIFEMSYNHLPNDLKSCLLYLGAFEEDKMINLSKLKQLWIAEGFVREKDGKKLEDIAEEYCMDLISRSLVTSTEERSLGGVKSCGVHDLVREFCIKKAEEESFLCVDDGSKVYSINDQRRLIIYSDMSKFFEENPFGYTVRSLLQYSDPNYSWRSGRTGYVIINLKLLRVLDSGNGDYGVFISKIDSLIHMRYLSIRAEGLTSIPSSICNLWNLQFLHFRGSGVSVPDSLWDMVHLRIVKITGKAFFEVHPRRLEKSVLLEKLHTLGTAHLCYGKDTENLLRRLPNLQNLSCVVDIKDETTELTPRYPVFDFLEQLKSLKVWFYSLRHIEQRKHIKLNLPSNLKKLYLSDFWGYSEDISEMGRILPNLEFLKLHFNYSTILTNLKYGEDDDTWVVEDGDFPNLKYLELYNFDCNEWIASEYSFPVLEKLVLNHCQKLKEIPSDIGELPTLEMISVNKCKQSLCDFVREVQQNQEEYGNSELKVIISNPIIDRNVHGDTESDTEEDEEPSESNSEENEEPIESNTEEPIESNTEEPIESNTEEPIESNTEEPIESNTEEHEEPIESNTEEHEEPIESNTEEHEEPIESNTEEHEEPIESNTEENEGDYESRERLCCCAVL